MNSRIAGFLLASSLALGVPLVADAQNDSERGFTRVHARGHHSDAGPQRWLRGLNLTEAQRDQVFKIFHDQAPVVREHMSAARRASQELRQAAASPSFDRARARQLADAQARALAEVSYLRADSMSKVVALLTPEQREKLQQLRERAPQRGRG